MDTTTTTGTNARQRGVVFFEKTGALYRAMEARANGKVGFTFNDQVRRMVRHTLRALHQARPKIYNLFTLREYSALGVGLGLYADLLPKATSAVPLKSLLGVALTDAVCDNLQLDREGVLARVSGLSDIECLALCEMLILLACDTSQSSTDVFNRLQVADMEATEIT